MQAAASLKQVDSHTKSGPVRREDANPFRKVTRLVKSHPTTWLLFAIILVGAALRYALVDYGLPHLFHPDEISLVHETYKFWYSVLNGNFSLSTNVFSHLLTGVHGVHYVICWLIGSCLSASDFQRLVLLDDPSLYLSGRLMSATVDLGNIYLSYRLGLVLFGRATGLVAALGYAVVAIPLFATPWVKMDSLSLFFTLLAQIAIILAMRDREPGKWYRAGILTGVAIATRISALPLVVSLGVAYLLAPVSPAARESDDGRRRRGKVFISTLGLAGLAYLVLSFRITQILSQLLGQPRLFWTQPYLEIIASKAKTVWAGEQWRTPWMIISDNAVYYWDVMLGTLGWLGVAGVACGIALTLMHGDRGGKLSLVFPVLYLIPVLLFPAHMSHYVLLLLPFMLCYLGFFLCQVAQHVRVIAPTGWRYAMAVVGVGVFVIPAQVSATYVAHMALQNDGDTRARAKEWIIANIPAGETIAIEKYHELPTLAPPVTESPEENRLKLVITRELGLGSGLAREARQRERPQPSFFIVNLTMTPVFGTRGRSFENRYDFDLLRKQGVRYVITGGYIPDSYIPGASYPEFVRAHAKFQEHLELEGELVAAFTPAGSRQAIETVRLLAWFIVDPPLEIYRLPAAERRLSS